MNAAELLAENSRLKNRRANYEATWRQINQYVSLRKGTPLFMSLPGTKQTNRLYDSTAVKANRDLAAWMNNNLTSMAMEWFSLRLGVRGKQVDKEADEWLEECKQRLYDALRASNFQAEAQKLYLDLPSFCVGAMYMEEMEIRRPGFNGFHFITLCPGEYCVVLDENGFTGGLFREIDMKAQTAVKKWPDKVSDKLKGLADKKPLEEVKILQASFPASWFGGKHQNIKDFVSYHVEIDGKKILDVGGYDEFPFFVVPWERNANEEYGTGPGWDALPDILTLNEAKMLGLMEWALAIRPPLLVKDDGVIGSVRLRPGGLTTISKENAVEQFITQAKFSDSRLKEEDLKRSIKEIFHNDLVKFLPPVEESKQMTAYEVSKRAELVRLLGPAFGNITDYWLDPLIEKGFYMMLRAGAFSPPPDSIREIAAGGRESFKIEYEGPLAKAQRSQEIDSIVRTMEVLSPLSEMYPQIPDNFDPDEIAQTVALINGVPKRIIRGKEGPTGVKALREAKLKEAQEQKQLEAAGQVADAAGKAVPALQSLGPEGAKAMAGMMGNA